MSQLQVSGEAKIRDIQGPVVANSGVITALDGAASQYVRGDGTLADFPTSTGGGSSVSYYLNGSVNQGTFAGSTYYEMSKTPIIGAGTDFPVSTNGLVAQFITDANDPDLLEVPGGNFNLEFYFSVSNNTGNPTVYAELYKYDGATFTLLGSSQAVPESINQGTTIAPYYFAIPVGTAALALTDRIAIRIYANVDGRTVTLHTENSHLCQVVTTFSKGMVSLNNLTDQSQFITTGTSGTDFNIVSSGDTHTFNIPSASATNRGLITTGNQTIAGIKTFNANVQIANSLLLNNSPAILGAANYGALSYAKLSTESRLYITDENNFSSILSFTNTADYTYTFPASSGTIALTSDLSAYLPLTGGTLTGNLTINPSTTDYTLTVSTSTTNNTIKLLGSTASNTSTIGYWSSNGGTGYGALNFTPTNTRFEIVNGGSFSIYTSGNERLTIASTGAVNLGTNELTSGNVKINDTLYLKVATTYAHVSGYYGIQVGTNLFTINNSASTQAAFSLASLTTSRTFTLPDASGTLALTSNLSAYVPYTGATSNLDLGGYSLYLNNSQAVFGRNLAGSTAYALIGVNGSNKVSIDTSGLGVVLGGALSGTSATFSGNVNIGPTTTGFDSVSQIASSNTGNIINALTLQNTSNTETAGTGVNLNFGGKTNWLGRISTQFVGGTGGGDASMSFLTPSGGTLVTRLTIASSGSVGIGTSSPSSKLHVYDTVPSGSTRITVTNASDVIYSSAGIELVTHNGTSASVGTGLFSTSNNFTYGTISPNQTNLYGIRGGGIRLATGVAPIIFANGNADIDFASERMRITSGGNVLIGTNTANANTAGLQVNSTSGTNIVTVNSSSVAIAMRFFTSVSTQAGYIILDGSTTSYVTSSDYRLKHNLKDYNGIDLISKIKTYDYEWKADNTQSYGVLAHELQEIIPQAVFGEKDGEDMQGVDYSKLVPILVKSIQELEARIKQLENK